ncbi:MAG: ABC transporter permease [Bacillota bacterium]|nr:ABC transporter permease [Bacillota bacterium]
MNFVESIKAAMRSLKSNKLRTFLTMLGIIIGVAAVISLVSIGQGAKKSVTGSIEGLGSNLLIITPGQRQRGPIPNAAIIGSLRQEDLEAILTEVPSVKTASPELSVTMTVDYQEKSFILTGGELRRKSAVILRKLI